MKNKLILPVTIIMVLLVILIQSVRPVRNGKRLHALVKGSVLSVINNCGHLPHQERPDVVNPLIVGFLNKH